MRQLSDRARDLISRLYKKPFLGFGRWPLDLAVLEELTACGEPAAIPSITPALVSGSRQEALAAARVISALLGGAGAEELAWLDQHMRESWWAYGEEWRQLKPCELMQWVGRDEPGVLLFCLSSFHRNGYLREEAVRRLALIQDGTELPYLLLRLTDWVPQVRQIAQQAVVARIRPDYISHFVENLALVVRLQRAQRSAHSDLLQSIAGLLGSPAARGALIPALHHRSREVRRASIRYLMAGDPSNLEQWLPACLQASDPVIRLWAARSAAATLGGERLAGVLEGLLADPSPSVRREALGAWAASIPETAAEKLTAALLDRSRTVRDEARFHLRRRGGVDFAQFYRDALATTNPRRLATALAGLAETGGGTEAMEPHLSHPSALVRRTAVRGLMKLGGDQYIDMVVNRLFDEAPSVSRQAAVLLLPYAANIGAAQLWALFEKPAPPYVRKSLLRLLAALPKWESIHCLVRAAGDPDDGLARLARDQVVTWNGRFNLTQTAPSRAQLVSLEAALEQSEARLGAREVSHLRFAIQTFTTH